MNDTLFLDLYKCSYSAVWDVCVSDLCCYSVHREGTAGSPPCCLLQRTPDKCTEDTAWVLHSRVRQAGHHSNDQQDTDEDLDLLPNKHNSSMSGRIRGADISTVRGFSGTFVTLWLIYFTLLICFLPQQAHAPGCISDLLTHHEPTLRHKSIGSVLAALFKLWAWWF